MGFRGLGGLGFWGLGRTCIMVRWQSEYVNLVVSLKSLTVLRLVMGAVKRKENVTAETKTSITKLEERRGQKGANYATNADTK